MATSDLDNFKLEEENYDKLLAVFHIGTDVKRYLLEYYLSQNHLNLLDWLTNISKNFLQFKDIERARKRSSKIKPAHLGVNTIDTVLKYNCFDLFWDCCLLNTSLEDILNNHKDELYRIYRNSNKNYAGPSMSTQNSSQCLTKDQWDVLFKKEEHMVMDPEGGENNISASPGLTVSSLDSYLNVLILNIVCPLYKSVNAVSECQIRISRTAVLKYEIETPDFEEIWNKIETHILLIGIHCRFSDHFRRKCTAVKQATFNRISAQENRKTILEEGFNNPDLVNDSRFCDRLQKELELIAFEDTLYYEEGLCSNDVSVPLVNGQYRTGAYTECVVQKAEQNLQACKSLCATTNDTKEMGDLEKKKEKDGIQERINRHNHLKLVQLITDIGRDVLVEILKNRIPGGEFGQAFNGMKTRILQQLDNNQRQLLFPDNSIYSGDLTDLDISLLYIILRNFNTICPHLNGWGNKPADNDRSQSANIDRIRIMKNKYVSHSSTHSLQEAEFLITWKEIRQCFVELGGTEYTQSIDYLLTSEINPVIENELSIALEKLKESDLERTRMNINLEERLYSLHQELNMYKRNTFNNARRPECLGTVPLKVKISGDIVPSANLVMPADYRNEDLCVNSFEEGSLIINLDVSRSAIRDVGYFLNVIDMLLSALLQRHSAPIKDSSNYVIVSMEFPSLDIYTKKKDHKSDIFKTVQGETWHKTIDRIAMSVKETRKALTEATNRKPDSIEEDLIREKLEDSCTALDIDKRVEEKRRQSEWLSKILQESAEKTKAMQRIIDSLQKDIDKTVEESRRQSDNDNRDKERMRELDSLSKIAQESTEKDNDNRDKERRRELESLSKISQESTEKDNDNRDKERRRELESLSKISQESTEKERLSEIFQTEAMQRKIDSLQKDIDKRVEESRRQSERLSEILQESTEKDIDEQNKEIRRLSERLSYSLQDSAEKAEAIMRFHKKMKQHLFSFKKTSGTETCTGEHKKDVNVFGIDTTLNVTVLDELIG